jgi:hypothetical protein
MDVVVWLRGLGLGKYEAAFRERTHLNAIEKAVGQAPASVEIIRHGCFALSSVTVSVLRPGFVAREQSGRRAPAGLGLVNRRYARAAG